MLTGRLESAQPIAAVGRELNASAAVVIGGALSRIIERIGKPSFHSVDLTVEFAAQQPDLVARKGIRIAVPK